MSRISNISNVSKQRIHNITVHRNTSVESTGSVSAVDRVAPVANWTGYRNENYLLASDTFYDKLLSLKHEYKKFYHDEQELEQAIHELENGEERLSKNMVNLVEKYNQALVSLRAFDNAFNTNHNEGICDLVIRFKSELENIGIGLAEDGLLEVNQAELKARIAKSEYPLQFLFEPAKGLITRLYKAFRSIKAPAADLYETYSREVSPLELHGIIVDKKS